jgi:hypothetical protein
MISRGQAVVFLIAILIIAAVLRLVGVDYGLPHPLVSDEEILIGGALRMAQTGSLIPTLDPVLAHQLYYPVGLPYTFLAAFAPVAGLLFAASGFPPLSEFTVVLTSHLDMFFLVSRLVGAAFSVATVWIVYRLGAAMFASPIAGLFAAALLSVSWFHVLLGHFARHWSATVFFIWLTVWLAWRYYETPSARLAIWAGIGAAAGFAVSYIAVLGYGAFGLLHLIRYRANFLNRFLFFSMAICLSGVLASAALHVPAIERLVGGSAPVLPVDHSKSLGGYLATLGFYMAALWKAEPVLLIFGVAGGLLGLAKFRFHVLVFATAFLGYTVFLDFFMPLEDRYILPAIPLLVLLAGAGAGVLTPRIVRRRALGWGVALVVTICLVYAGWNAATFSGLLSVPDSRERAIAWIAERAQANDGVVIAMNPVKLSASTDALRVQEALEPSTLDALDRFAVASGRGGDYRAVHLNRFAPDALEGEAGAALLTEFRSQGFRFFAVALRHDLPRTGFHKELAQLANPVQVYDPTARDTSSIPPDLRTTTLVPDKMVHDYAKLHYLGPRVEIYDLQSVKRAPGL